MTEKREGYRLSQNGSFWLLKLVKIGCPICKNVHCIAERDFQTTRVYCPVCRYGEMKVIKEIVFEDEDSSDGR